MKYVCYIDLAASTVPHMEVLTAENVADAKAETVQLMRTHTSAVGATIYDGADCVAIIAQAEKAA